MATICVLQAADTIGGNCIEVKADNGDRIFLDAGKPLDMTPDAVPVAPVGMDFSAPCLGVLVSHSHQDHHGVLNILPEKWPVHCGKATWELLALDAVIRGNGIRQQPVFWEANIPFRLGSFTITSFLIDHSAFDAYFLLIEVDGKRILYTGDFRGHGRKGVLTKRILDNPPENIDVLIMEGTNLPGKFSADKDTRSESELEDEFAGIFRQTSGRVFVSVASTNIDRIVTLFRACKKSGRVFVVDLYTMIVLRTLGKFAKLPQPEWKDAPIMAVVTGRMLRFAERLGHPDLVKYLKDLGKAMSARKLTHDKGKWVAMIRSSMTDDYRRKGVVPDAGDTWLWSLWSGYLRNEKQKELTEFFGGRSPIVIHASGHASPIVLAEMAKAVNPKILIPVHGTEWCGNTALFGDVPVRIVMNGENVHV